MENNKPSWIDDDNDTAPAESTSPPVQPSSYSKSTGEVTSWFSKPRGAANNPPAKPAPESKADPIKIQGTNPARTNGGDEEGGGWTGDWQPSWSKPAQHTPSSPPDVEAARPETTTTRPRVPTTTSNGPGNEPLDVDQETLNAMSRAHWAVKILYMSACVLMGAAAGLSLAPATSSTSSQASTSNTSISSNQGTATNNVGSIFFACYVLLFCLLMCCFECGLNFFSTVLAINFGFLYTLSGRLVFLLFVGFMSFSLSTFGIAAMAYLYLVGLIHMGIMLYYPKFSQYVRQKDYFGGSSVR